VIRTGDLDEKVGQKGVPFLREIIGCVFHLCRTVRHDAALACKVPPEKHTLPGAWLFGVLFLVHGAASQPGMGRLAFPAEFHTDLTLILKRRDRWLLGAVLLQHRMCPHSRASSLPLFTPIL